MSTIPNKSQKMDNKVMDVHDGSQGSACAAGEGLVGGQAGWTKCLYLSGAAAWGGDGMGVSGEAAVRVREFRKTFIPQHEMACTRSTYRRVECEWRARCWWPGCVQSAGPGPPVCVPGGGGGSAWARRLDLQTAQHREQLMFDVGRCWFTQQDKV